MRLADYVISFLADCAVDTAFLVTGGAAMHLNDALAGEARMRKVCCHHEQAAAIAAEGYARVTGRPALVQVTAGPGSINAMTGVFGAYVDSLPMIVVSGQAKRELLRSSYGFLPEVRQLGEQEVDTVGIASPITKYVRCIDDPSRIRYELEKAFHLATVGRMGPVCAEMGFGEVHRPIGVDLSLPSSEWRVFGIVQRWFQRPPWDKLTHTNIL